MIETDEDRAIFTDPREFGEVVTVKPNGADPFDIPVLWDITPRTEGVARGGSGRYTGNAKVSGGGIHFECQTALLAGLTAHRDMIERGGRLYDIQEIMPPDRGMSVVRLMEA